jgi:hypothetical protein
MHFNSSSVKHDIEHRGGGNFWPIPSIWATLPVMRCTILTLALIACRDRSPPPPPPAPAQVTEGVTLIQPGAAPHRALRYQLTKGTRTRSELVTDVEIKSDEQTGPAPTLVVGFETEVADVLADGTAKLRLTITHTSVRERPGSVIAGDLARSQAAAMHGVVITETLGPDGQLADARVEVAPGIADKVRAQLEDLTRSLQQVAMRMPAEPVGLGAMWRERRTLPEGGIRAVSETMYTLTSLMDGVIGYTSLGRSTASPQTIEQEGMTVEITSLLGTSQARGSVDLSRYGLSVTSSSQLTTEMNVHAPEGTPGAGPSKIEIMMAIQMTSADATSAAPIDTTGGAQGSAVPSEPAGSAGTGPASGGAAPREPAGSAGAGSTQGAHRAP